ncbi:hypothetical protein OFO03_06155 [Campylobacter sp. JMF_02 ED1]|uniref:hypothetical protein n=1 Tax=unclassified Campylobacter TaxID=2593542 RepID=UPI0022E9F8B2|nr:MULTISPECIES: hypothetical protein [unclassified Campylobacter]MDA3049097.1 hypothetical protein [Campylobacter sp. JMF_15 NE4]MDA3051478.1 hypothetical protein [Campylobacter sp. JMF_02 ED1]
MSKFIKIIFLFILSVFQPFGFAILYKFFMAGKVSNDPNLSDELFPDFHIYVELMILFGYGIVFAIFLLVIGSYQIYKDIKINSFLLLFAFFILYATMITILCNMNLKIESLHMIMQCNWFVFGFSIILALLTIFFKLKILDRKQK